MKGKLLTAALAALLCGCGVVYTSPSVSKTEGELNVRVVPMTFETVTEANLTDYVPARLPPYFRPEPQGRIAPMSASRAAAGARAEGLRELPSAATMRTGGPGAGQVRLPPATEPAPYRVGVADELLLAADTSGATMNDVPALVAAQNRRNGYIVQDDGAIAVPGVGRVRVAGLTLEQAEAAIFDAMVAQRLDPTFSLEIAAFNSQRVSVGGAVRQPSLQPISLKPLYLTEALQLSGGVDAADQDYAVVKIYRDGQLYQAPLRRLYSDSALADVLLRDGDSVFVDTSYDVDRARRYFEEQLQLRNAEMAEQDYKLRSLQAQLSQVQLQQAVAQFNAQLMQQEGLEAERQREAFKDRLELGAVQRDYAYVAGQVRNPRRFALPFETRASLADILMSGNGINSQFGDYAEIYVLRRAAGPDGFGAVTAYHLDATNAAALTGATSFEMRPNDVIFVAEQPVTSWNRAISQLTPQYFLQAANTSVTF